MSRNSRNPISWVPTVYFAMGLPFVVLNMVSVLMFKGLGIDDAQIALWTSLIMLPWTLKFLWSPFLEMFKTCLLYTSWIGHSYNRDRWLEGEISECRIWNKVLTADEINAKNHFYLVEPDSEGLVAYWKFDEGTGQTVTDYTGNGNNGMALDPISWVEVALPEK